MILASAPGKLFIAGEYAVLDGGVALVTAVGARAKVRVETMAGRTFNFRHPVSGDTLAFDLDREGSLHWSDANPGHWGDVLAAVVATWFGKDFSGPALPTLSIGVDTDAFFARAAGMRRKLGFGSSAAATVALSRAIIKQTRSQTDANDFARFCLAAHSRLQDGRGSGVDVLASLNGGVIAASGGRADCQSMNWPAGLHMLAVWSGVEASTSVLVSRFDSYRQNFGNDFSRHIGDLREVSSRAVAAWQAGDVPLILSTLRDFDAALLQLDSAAGIGIYPQIHGQLRAIAETSGAVYKVSGAGGGDFGLAFSPTPEIAQRARDAFEASGYLVFDGSIAETGVRVDSD